MRLPKTAVSGYTNLALVSMLFFKIFLSKATAFAKEYSANFFRYQRVEYLANILTKTLKFFEVNDCWTARAFNKLNTFFVRKNHLKSEKFISELKFHLFIFPQTYLVKFKSLAGIYQ